jgi:hypothetical protein
MKAVVRDAHWDFPLKYVHCNDSNGNVVSYIEGLEYDLLKVIWKQMNINFVHVPTPNVFETSKIFVNDLIVAMLAKEAYIVLGSLANTYITNPIFGYTHIYYTMKVR